MDSNFKNLKNTLKCLKEQKSNVKSSGTGYIKYSDIIKEKLELNNKKEESVFKNFEESEKEKETRKEKEEWNKIRNVKKNKEQEELFVDKTENKNNINNISETDNNNDSDTKSILSPDDFDLKLSTKEYTINIDPKELIEEVTEQNDTKRIINPDKYPADFKCKQLYNWFHLMFKAWEKELDSLPNDEKISGDGKLKLGIYKQCRGYIKPLLHLLKRNEVSKEIMNKLFEVMVFCIDRDYIRAHDKYIELAIGNAPWPVGVTMVGIHERSGRSRIYKSQVAHILNDENTKKYLQSVKRIMSLVQRLFPNKPSNSVYS